VRKSDTPWREHGTLSLFNHPLAQAPTGLETSFGSYFSSRRDAATAREGWDAVATSDDRVPAVPRTHVVVIGNHVVRFLSCELVQGLTDNYGATLYFLGTAWVRDLRF
jgi:hypothetical protein